MSQSVAFLLSEKGKRSRAYPHYIGRIKPEPTETFRQAVVRHIEEDYATGKCKTLVPWLEQIGGVDRVRVRVLGVFDDVDNPARSYETHLVLAARRAGFNVLNNNWPTGHAACVRGGEAAKNLETLDPKAAERRRAGARKGGGNEAAAEALRNLARDNPEAYARMRTGGHNAQATLKQEGKGFYNSKVQQRNGRAAQVLFKREGRGIYDPKVRQKMQMTLKRESKSFYNPEVARSAAFIANHNRWHIARSITHLNCKLCQAESTV